MLPKTINLALIGYGPWGRAYHRTLDSLSSFQLSRLCRANPSNTPRGVLDRLETVTSSVVEAISGAEGVIIATPPAVMKEVLEECLRQDKPVILEKPVALTMADTEEMMNMCSRSCIDPMVCYTHLFNPAFEAVSHMGRKWTDHNPVTIDISIGKPKANRIGTPTYLDWGPHAVSMAMSIIGSHAEIQDAGIDQTSQGTTYFLELKSDRGLAKLHFGSGFYEARAHMIVETNGRTLVYDDSKSANKKATVDGHYLRYAYEEPLKRAVISFGRYIRQGLMDYKFDARFHLAVMDVLTSAGFLVPTP